LKANKSMKIYIAGPYTAKSVRDVHLNVYKAIEIAVKIWKKGHYPYIPHLTHFVWTHPSGNLEYEDWMKWGKVWLECCDALFLLNNSPGADQELKYAKKLGLKIYYSINDIPEVNKL